MLSRFYLIPGRYGQTDLLYQYRAIKTIESDEYTCQSQQCNNTNSAAILRMEVKHVAAYLTFFNLPRPTAATATTTATA